MGSKIARFRWQGGLGDGTGGWGQPLWVCDGKIVLFDPDSQDCDSVCPACCNDPDLHASQRIRTDASVCSAGHWNEGWVNCGGGCTYYSGWDGVPSDCNSSGNCDSILLTQSVCFCIPDGWEMDIDLWGAYNDAIKTSVIVDGVEVISIGDTVGSADCALSFLVWDDRETTTIESGLHCIQLVTEGVEDGKFDTGIAMVSFNCSSIFVPTSASIEDYYNSNDDTDTLFGGTTWLGQSFITSEDYLVKKVKLELKRVGNPSGNVDVGLKATDGNGRPTGSYLRGAVKSFACSSIDTSMEWIEFDFSAHGIFLDKSTRYAIVVSAPDATTNNDMRWRRQNSNGYGNGDGHRSTDSGSSWDTRTWSFMFEVWKV